MNIPDLVITSCQAFAAHSIPPLLASLERAKYPAEQTLIVWDGPSMTGAGVVWLHSDLRCYEMTGALEWGQTAHSPFLSIHDTCIVGPSFLDRARAGYKAMQDTNANVGGNLPNHMHCCLGFFRPDFIRRHHAFLKGCLHARSKRDAVDFEISGTLVKLAEERYRGLDWGLNDGIRRVDIYGTGNPRWERYFPGLDLYKYTLSDTLEGISEHPTI